MPHPLEHPRVDWDLLQAFDFDEARFRLDAERIAKGALTPEISVIHGRIEPATEVIDVVEDEEALELGRVAFRHGRVAVLVLNGGMATRFGGVVKGTVEVFEGESFLSLKAASVLRRAVSHGARVPLVLMNSFATRDETAQHIDERRGLDLGDDLLSFDQSISLRLEEDGSLFLCGDGAPSYHAPGHGDFLSCIRRSGVLSALRARGVEHLFFSNVDNLGATPDPLILGHHLRAGRPMSVEVTEKRRTASGAWDRGGAPARVDGKLFLVEGFRFPPGFAEERLPDFSTNNMLFELAAIDRELLLDRHVVKKKVEGRSALQLESITCEACGLEDEQGRRILPMTLLRVPREGPRGRFFPVKEPEDLDAMRAAIRARLRAEGVF